MYLIVHLAKYSALSDEDEQAISITDEGAVLTITFDQAFDTEPEIGLSIYNFQVSYNPNFGVRVLGAVRLDRCQVEVNGLVDPNVPNELFLMFIASDYKEKLGVYRIESLSNCL